MRLTKVAECAENLINLQQCIESNNACDSSLEYLFGDELRASGIDLSGNVQDVLKGLNDLIPTSLEALTKEQMAHIKKLYTDIEKYIAMFKKDYVELSALHSKAEKMLVPVARREINLEYSSITYYSNVRYYNIAIDSMNDILNAMNSGRYVITSHYKQLLKAKSELESRLEKPVMLSWEKGESIDKQNIMISGNYISSIKNTIPLLARNLQYVKKIMDMKLEYTPKFFQKKSPTPSEVLTAIFQVYSMTLRVNKIKIDFERAFLSNIKEQ